MGRCKVPECSGTTEYDENAQAVLCTTCGTVATQDILRNEWDGELSGGSLYFGPTTLKSLRRAGAGLAGQSSKEDKDRRNTTAMHHYILGILTKLAYPGLAPRARNVFDQARLREKFRWGKKALLVAAASILVAIRESKKGVMMAQLASLMDISPYALCRVFTHICTLLSLRVPPFDAISLLPHLLSHVVALARAPNSPLPQALIDVLLPLPSVPVLHLASSLASLLNHLDGFSYLGPSSSPSACALLLAALEGQAGSSLPSYLVLARELGAKAGARKDLVIGRYHDISNTLEQWMVDVPWLSDPDHPDNMIGPKRRKIARRSVIAAGIKDVVQFREDIAKTQRSRDVETMTVALEAVEECDDEESSVDAMTQVGQKRKRSGEQGDLQPSKSLRLLHSRTSKPAVSQVDLASLSLLSPSHPFSPDLLSSDPSKASRQTDSLQNQILTSSRFPGDVHVTLTRLQQLAVSRGGESEIDDDELFERDELESFLRSEDEVVLLREMLGWDEAETNPEVATGVHDEAAIATDSRPVDWEMADLAVWEDMGNNRDVDDQSGEQILGDWREVSPFPGMAAAEEDNFDVCDEW